MKNLQGIAAGYENDTWTHDTSKIDLDQTAGFTRKNSFGNTLNKLTNRTNSVSHHRRMTITSLPSYDVRAAATLGQSRKSRLPTPSAITRSSSFFGNSNTSVVVGTDGNSMSNTSNASNTTRYRKVSEKFIQLPFFNQQNQSHAMQRPLSPRTKRESSIKIEHRGLMAPIQPLSLPRSSTMSDITQQSSNMLRPSFMRPTSSSANRRQSMTHSQRLQTFKPPDSSISTAVFPATAQGSSHYGLCRQRTNTLTSDEREWLLASSSSSAAAKCFPVRRPSLALQYSPPPRAVTFVTKTTGMMRTAGSTHQSILARSVHNPESSLPPTATTKHLLTPKHDCSTNIECENPGTYAQSQYGLTEDDESNMALTRRHGNVETFNYPPCNRHISNETHNQAFPIPNQADRTFDGQGSDKVDKGPNLTTHVVDSDSPEFIHEAKPTTFWLGRHTAISDHIRTDSLSSSLYSPIAPPVLSTGSARYQVPAGMLDAVERNKQVFGRLHSLCATEEARSSLAYFKAEYEAKYGDDGEGGKVVVKQRVLSTASSTMSGKGVPPGGGGGGEGVKEEKKGKGWLNPFRARNRG